MAYPTGLLSRVLEDVDRDMADVRAGAVRLRAELAAGNTSAARVKESYTALWGYRVRITAAAAVPGIGAYAQEQKGNPSLNVGAEFTAVMNAISGVITWMEANYPKDGEGYLLDTQFNSGTFTTRVFTPAQSAGLRTVLDTLIATIN